MKNQIFGLIKGRRKKKDFFSDNLFNDETERPARILTSEEINNMINKQAQYSETHPNLNEYNIIINNQEFEEIEKNKSEVNKKAEDIDKIKSEIEGFQFDEEEEGKDKEKNKIEIDLKDDKKMEEIKNSLLNLDTV